VLSPVLIPITVLMILYVNFLPLGVIVMLLATELAERILVQPMQHYSPGTLLFWYQKIFMKFQWRHLSTCAKYMSVAQICDFRPVLVTSLKQWKVKWLVWFKIVDIPMTFSDPNHPTHSYIKSLFLFLERVKLKSSTLLHSLFKASTSL